VKDVFSRFCFFIKQVSKDGTQLQNQLDKLEAYLACQKAKNQNFLCGNQASTVHLLNFVGILLKMLLMQFS
jgi:hypothetical protein